MLFNIDLNLFTPLADILLFHQYLHESRSPESSLCHHRSRGGELCLHGSLGEKSHRRAFIALLKFNLGAFK